MPSKPRVRGLTDRISAADHSQLPITPASSDGRCKHLLAVYSRESVEVTVCELKGKPGDFNQKLVEVTGLVSHGFEDFGLFDPACPEWPYVWLEYEGTKKSGTIYCCGVSADRSRPKELTVEGITAASESVPRRGDRPSSSLRGLQIGGKRSPTKAMKREFYVRLPASRCCALRYNSHSASFVPIAVRVNNEAGLKITELELGAGDRVVRFGSRGSGVAGSFSQCAFASLVW